MLKVLWEFYKEEANLSRQIASRDALNTYLLHSSYDKLCRSVFFRMNNFSYKYICLTSVTGAKCGIRSTLCWKIANISGSTELFAL